jgi:hypothetical protein
MVLYLILAATAILTNYKRSWYHCYYFVEKFAHRIVNYTLIHCLEMVFYLPFTVVSPTKSSHCSVI